MLSKTTLSFLMGSALFFTHCTASTYNSPVLHSRHELQGRSPVDSPLGKRAKCSDGSQCLIGQCCGGGCAPNCCAHDNGGVGCGITEQCSFKGNVFIGCCSDVAIGGCTSEATRVTVHTPYSTVTLQTGAAATTADATTSTSESTSDSTSASLPSSTDMSTTSTSTATSSSAAETSESATASESSSAQASETSSGGAAPTSAPMFFGGSLIALGALVLG
ncbi:hypothetical protein ASPWEDRAFT_72689 [Aspergillus wentii DTO 134E9]|uniref:GPI anchored protein n=1 Tax=Aspergillus wentii DTO 134E9 TaxID=1073089 RepID=A0A1L9R5N6_ASPWE|nr:uncharacterized protein ASPWEDRAFT_72689 [Aspergillus wentii DTO 134E9]KAI9925269.1 hypothetical protein MW887_006194 [Aspergillus wentii]OJJ30236.1 hypothetical protein ASPWEDRAFT_72689 [Aspergillus wentii DTO 134E9]